MSAGGANLDQLWQLAQAADGALLGFGLACGAVRTISECFRTSSALNKIRDAPSVSVADLRSILSSPDEGSSDAAGESGGKGGGGVGGEILVVVRGTVDAKSAVEGGWMNALLSSSSKQNAVIVQKTQSCIYNGFVGYMPWAFDIRTILNRALKEESSFTRTIPFVLRDSGQQSLSNYLVVNMEGSKHPLPLMIVHHQMQPIKATAYTLLQSLFGRPYAVGILDQEKILPTGKEITAVGVCSLKGGVPDIKSCNGLPYFLSDLGKQEMIAELSFKQKVLTWSSVAIGSITLGVLGYAIVRNWKRWRESRERARIAREQARDLEVLVEEEEPEEEDVPEGQLCVLCLARRRQSAFVPCGHMVCCHMCGLMIEREIRPKCPVCRQSICSSVRIYAS